MKNYLNNNILLINEYEKMYYNGINISSIIDKFRNDELLKSTSFDYGRFRVFTDSCLLLFNKEKLNKYVKGEYCFADFFDKVEKDPQLITYMEYIRNNSLFSDIKKPCIFYSVAGMEKGPWNQVATIRNAFAHMQYGNFCAQESGLMIFYGIYNKDKGVKKDEGIIFEPVMHEFVKGFFSNYSFGIPFRSSFFMCYSLKDKRGTSALRFYVIKAKKNINKIYDGYSSNVISDLIKQFNNNEVDIISYINSNELKYEIEEYKVDEKINLSSFDKCSKKYQLNTNDKYFYGIKTILDFETEISNFLIHIGQINSVLYEFSVLRNCGNYTNQQVAEYRLQYEKMIKELIEDESADLAFKIGFAYLKILNFSLRTEDDDYAKINYPIIDVSKFEFVEEALKKYIFDNQVTDAPRQRYVVERVRNSIMHGNINCEVEENGEILIVFTDCYNNRKDIIKILLSDLEDFLRQECLYNGIPSQTEVLRMEQAE